MRAATEDVFAYVRVSDDPLGRAEESHESQLDIIRAHDPEAKLTVFCEIKSGTKDNIDSRPEFARMLSMCRPGVTVKVSRQDRFARNARVFLNVYHELKSRGARLVCIKEGFDSGAETSTSKLFLTIKAAIAEHDAETIKDNLLGMRRRLTDAGLSVQGKPPLGCTRVDRKLVPNEHADVIRELFAMAEHTGIKLIRKHMRAAHPTVHRWSESNIHDMLRNRLYVGQTTRSDGSIIDSHEPIVSVRLFEAVQEALVARRRAAQRRYSDESITSSWLLRGLANCGVCGARMGPRFGRVGRDATKKHSYYSCAGRARDRTSCAAKYGWRVDALDAEIDRLILDRLIEVRVHASSPPQPRERVDTTAKRAEIQRRVKRLVAGYEAGAIELDELTTRRAELYVALRKLDEDDRAAHMIDAASSTERRNNLIVHVGMIRMAWDALEPSAKRTILSHLARSIVLTHGEPPRIEWRSVEELIS